jgi:class 3 adenylate cyclase/tetratricopeptide (TPR) repeat protein
MGLQADQLSRYIPRELLAKLESARDSRLMQGERRIVTILFCDVAGSSAAASHLDPEEWAEIINGGFSRMIQPVYHYEGTVARLQGDGLLAFFGAPIAHEDDPQRAILAGLEILQAVKDYTGQVKKVWGIDFNVRVGINTGLVVVGEVGSDLRVEYSALGDAINLAARMEQTALPGSLQIAGATYKLVAPLFDFEIVENMQVKGYSEPLTAYRVLGRKAAPGRLRGIAGLEAPLVGRHDQMETLVSAAARLMQGRGEIVSVTAEAGLGKSRLVAEFHGDLLAGPDPGPGLLWLEGRSFSYEGTTPFASFIDLLRRYFGFPSDLTGAEQFEWLKSKLELIFPSDRLELASFLATMLGLPLSGEDADRVRFLDPAFLRLKIFTAVFQLIERLALAQPVVLYLDDLHWADQSSLALLQSLLPLTDQAPLMILAAFRPRMQEPSWAFHEMAIRDYSHRYHNIPLTPLDESQSRQLVASLLEVEDLPNSVRLKILEKAEGNPFFLEEVVRSLLDRGLIVRQDNHWRATQEILTIEFPDTLVGVITARLDNLEDGVKSILQAASVVGREFALPVLADLLASPEGLERGIIELQRREYVREKSVTQHIFTFKHILTQEAAYNSILLSNRRELHRRAAESMIVRTPDDAAAIAHHLLEARQSGRAVPYLIVAGERAARAYSNLEAIALFSQALEFSEGSLDRAYLRRAYEGLGAALAFVGRIPEALELYRKMKAQAVSSGDVLMEISALNKLASVNARFLGQFQEADVFLDQAIALSQEKNQHSLFSESALIRCQMCTARADFETVTFTMAEVIQVSQENDSPQQEVLALEHLASSLLYLVRFDEARQKANTGISIARQIGDREHEAGLLTVLGFCDLSAGQVDAAREELQEALQIGQLIGSIYTQSLAGWGLSLVDQYLGLYEDGLHTAQSVLQVLLPMEQWMPFVVIPLLGILGSLYLEISPAFHDQAIDLHTQALRLLETPSGGMTGGAAWADLGFCAITAGDLAIAEQTLSQGLTQPNMFSLLERPHTLAGAAALSLVKKDPQAALRQSEEGLEFAAENGMRHHEPLAFLMRGRAHLAMGESTQAMDDFERAASLANELGFRPLLWQARLEIARALSADGLPELAQASLDQARLVIDGIAGLFQEDDLRQGYLDSAIHRLILN